MLSRQGLSVDIFWNSEMKSWQSVENEIARNHSPSFFAMLPFFVQSTERCERNSDCWICFYVRGSFFCSTLLCESTAQKPLIDPIRDHFIIVLSTTVRLLSILIIISRHVNLWLNPQCSPLDLNSILPDQLTRASRWSAYNHRLCAQHPLWLRSTVK